MTTGDRPRAADQDKVSRDGYQDQDRKHRLQERRNVQFLPGWMDQRPTCP